jgi:hypothetical protein
MQVDDLTVLSEDLRETEMLRIIERQILEPIDVAVSPLFGLRLAKLRDEDYVLIIAMEHIISDMVSLNILSRDLFALYMQALTGRAASLPRTPMQFSDYAVWQRNAERFRLEKHGAYWRERLSGLPRLRFPQDTGLSTASRLGWAALPLRIGRELKSALREWCRLRQTTVVIGVFTAFAGLLLRWCNVQESVVQYTSDGRCSPNIENTIGLFASVLYVRISLYQNDSFIDLMKRLTDEYCNAYDHADCSYMTAQVPRPEFARNCLFNWIARGSENDLRGFGRAEHALACSQVSFENPLLKNLELDHEPVMVLYDTDDEVVGSLYYSASRVSADTMDGFRRNFMEFISALLRQPDGRVRDIQLLQ